MTVTWHAFRNNKISQEKHYTPVIIIKFIFSQNAERRLEGQPGDYSDSEQSDSDSSSDDDAVDGPCRLHDSSDEEEEQPRRSRNHEYQNVSQLEWDHSTM